MESGKALAALQVSLKGEKIIYCYLGGLIGLDMDLITDKLLN